MNNKTCGECRFHDKDDQCSFFGFTRPASLGVCRNFQQLPSNGDKIRQMSNEELGELFALSFMCDTCPLKDVECVGGTYANCYDKQLAWLNAPAESEAEE